MTATIETSERDKESASRFANPAFKWRRAFAELWGTFLLVLVGAGGAVASAQSGGELSRTAAAVGPGIMVMVAVYFIGSVSGAHLNPAVTLAFALRRNFPWTRVPGYVTAQLVGAALAAGFLRALFGPVADIGATVPSHGVTALKAVVIEGVITAGLVNVILATASGARNIGTNAGIAVGGYIALTGLWASTFTGASMNPARTLGPDLLRGDFSTTWVYLVGPLVGAVVGVAFEWILIGPPTKSGSVAAQGEDDRV